MAMYGKFPYFDGLFLVIVTVLTLEILKFVAYSDGIHPRGQAPRHSAC